MYHYISLIIDYYLGIVGIDLLILRYQSHVHWYGENVRLMCMKSIEVNKI